MKEWKKKYMDAKKKKKNSWDFPTDMEGRDDKVGTC